MATLEIILRSGRGPWSIYSLGVGLPYAKQRVCASVLGYVCGCARVVSLQPLCSPFSLASKLQAYLKQFASLIDAPYVHPEIISFKDGTDRKNWSNSY